ncbi:MAG: peroxiredoxin [Paraburkholderia sp.]|jgi:peroxiredoxin (alkyl hydroperoxide reductase subunit C)|uniref:peroxiredoxin n=1 Tax=Paraburkholderia sp. TaxID=1926495 RepID=UPI00397B1FB1
MTDTPIPLPLSRPLRIGDRAPDFHARTTCGDRALKDYHGNWLLLFAHPADFTPVCTSEFISLAKAQPRFEELGCQLLGISVDSLYAHVAWLRDIHEHFDVKVTFPIVEDPSMAIATAYGMLDPQSPDAASVRASYVIDPQGTIRAMTWYPMNVGRSVNEQLRLIRALQAADASGASTPEGWDGEGPLLASTPITLEESLSSEADPKTPWYYQRARSQP